MQIVYKCFHNLLCIIIFHCIQKLIIKFNFIKAFEEVLNNIVKNIAKANVFFMVSNEDISRAYEFCKRYKVSPQSNVISQAENKKVFYERFYDILERQMTSFLHGLQARTFTGDVGIEKELKGLIDELHERKITTKPKLTAQCLARIKKYIKI